MTNDSVQPLKANRVPLSIQAEQYLHDLIERETYHAGEQLPSEADLASQLGISRPTLREALRNLQQGGLIIRKHGVGTFVAPGYEHRLESGLERLESILELATRQGLAVTCNALQVREETASAELAEKLAVHPGTPLTNIRRTIEVGGVPVAYMIDLVLSSVLSTADVDDCFNGSVLDLLRQKPDLNLGPAVAEIIALDADAFLTEKLEVQLGQAVMLMEEVVFDAEGKPVEFSRNYFVPEFFQFRVVRR
jgi:GntR family transcriptional regulator